MYPEHHLACIKCWSALKSLKIEKNPFTQQNIISCVKSEWLTSFDFMVNLWEESQPADINIKRIQKSRVIQRGETINFLVIVIIKKSNLLPVILSVVKSDQGLSIHHKLDETVTLNYHYLVNLAVQSQSYAIQQMWEPIFFKTGK